MRISFWPDKARRSVLGPAWPWLSLDAGDAFTQRIRTALDPYWGRRLTRVSEDIIAPKTVETLQSIREQIDADTVGGGGYEKVQAAAAGDGQSFWFFDLGMAAWIAMIGHLMRGGWLGDESPLSYEELQEVWRKEGPEAACNLLDEKLTEDPASYPGLNLHRVPLALWQEKDVEKATLALDRAVSGLSTRTIEACGPTVPITYALLLALRGDVQGAEKFLREDRLQGRPVGLAGFTSPEARYHRARYLWDLGKVDEVMPLLKSVLAAAPSHVLRLVTDPAFTEINAAHQSTLHQMIAEVAGTARSRLARWQQSQAGTKSSNPQVSKLRDILQFEDHSTYMVLAAASAIDEIEAWRVENEAVDAAFWTDLDRLEQFADELPTHFPLRLGPDFMPRFTGPESDMERLIAHVEKGQLRRAAHLMGRLYSVTPWAVKMGSLSYAARLTNALATAGDVLRHRGRDEDRPRFEVVYGLLERCVALAEPIKGLPDRLGPGLVHQVSKIWEEITSIEESWVKAERQQFGRMRLVAPENVRSIQRGGWASFQVRVTDVSGAPVAGVPVLWHVAEGPAYPKAPADCLDGEWALSLHTGTVHMTVEARGQGKSGIIRASILGEHSPVELPFQVTESRPG